MNERWIETHAHLDDRRFDGDLTAVIERAAAAGVCQIITVGADLPSSRQAVSIAEAFPHVYATVGVHPHYAASVQRATLEELRRLATHPRVVAIGEIGLDFYRDLSPRDAQRAALESQLALAAEAGKPVVIHIRDRRGQSEAYEQAIATLRSWLAIHTISTLPGVLHCFSGRLEVAQEAIALGFYIGVDGPVTYPNARALQAMVAQLPLTRLLLETDCPYLTPQPRRGRRNEPAYLHYIGQKVAELQGCPVDRVARATTANARRLFNLPERADERAT